MASIPLPALAAQNNAPSPVQTYTTLAQLMGAREQQQLAAQEVQGAQLENQVRQRQLSDQEAMSAAMRQWDGKDPDELPGLVVKAGGSANAVLGLRSQILDMKTKAATLTKDQLANQSTINDQIAGHLENVKGASPEDKQATYTAAINDLQQKGYVQPGQLPVQYPGDDKIDLFEKQFMGQKAILSQAQSESTVQKNTAQANEANTAAQKNTAESLWYKLHPEAGAPGVPAEVQSQAAWLAAHPGKTAADYQVAMKKIVPAFNFNLQSGVNGTIPLNANQKAQAQAILEGRMKPPSAFAQKTPYWQNVMGAVLQEDPQWTEQRAELRQSYTVGKQSTEINAINTAMGHVGALGDAIDALNNGNVQLLNKIANGYGIQTGETPAATFKLIVNRVGPEIAKAYMGSGGGEAERLSIEKDLSPNMSPAQLRSNVSETVDLLRSKISALENQWDQNKSSSMPSFEDRFIMPQAKAVLQKYAPQGNGAKQNEASGAHPFFSQFGGSAGG